MTYSLYDDFDKRLYGQRFTENRRSPSLSNTYRELIDDDIEIPRTQFRNSFSSKNMGNNYYLQNDDGRLINLAFRTSSPIPRSNFYNNSANFRPSNDYNENKINYIYTNSQRNFKNGRSNSPLDNFKYNYKNLYDTALDIYEEEVEKEPTDRISKKIYYNGNILRINREQIDNNRYDDVNRYGRNTISNSSSNIFMNSRDDYIGIKSVGFGKETNKIYRGYSLDNIFESQNRSELSFGYKVSNYSSSSLAGTNCYGTSKTNQDAYLIKIDRLSPSENEYTFGVFDGHGQHGHFVSQAIKQFFINCDSYNFNTKPMLHSVFASLSQQINNNVGFDNVTSGSTCILVHINQEKIICANCGDSRAILITKNNSIIPLSRDHKPELFDEKERIERSGGRVAKIFENEPFRVYFIDHNYPGLAMSRSIGDKMSQEVGVIGVPEIREVNINIIHPLALVVASDGVWEFMTNEDVRDMIRNFVYNQDAAACARNIVERSRQIWANTGYARDDITCIVSFFEDE